MACVMFQTDNSHSSNITLVNVLRPDNGWVPVCCNVCQGGWEVQKMNKQQSGQCVLHTHFTGVCGEYYLKKEIVKCAVETNRTLAMRCV